MFIKTIDSFGFVSLTDFCLYILPELAVTNYVSSMTIDSGISAVIFRIQY